MPRGTAAIIHHDMLPRLAAEGFYPSKVTIQRPIRVQSLSGEEEVDHWENVYEHVRAAVSVVLRHIEEWRNWRIDFVMEQVTHNIALPGLYPDIQADWRLVVEGTDPLEIHNISSRHLDSHVMLTRVMTRVTYPAAEPGLG